MSRKAKINYVLIDGIQWTPALVKEKILTRDDAVKKALLKTGHVQAYIPFAGVSNEMAFCFCAFMLGGILLICLLPNKKQRSGES
jgi:hypothetical protein